MTRRKYALLLVLYSQDAFPEVHSNVTPFRCKDHMKNGVHLILRDAMSTN